mgnify:CR=1 FL=1|nr:MAG TPA: hypothetical protein [Caudoviricetes sp.]
MKKIFLSIIFLLSCFGAFAHDTQLDVLAGGFYNYSKVFAGTASYQKYINYNYYDFDGDYRAAFKAAGGFLGFDMFFNSCPFGLYFRAGFMGVFGVNRTAGGETVALDNTEVNFNMFYDFGGVYALNVNKYFSICAAPAVSMLFVNSEYVAIEDIYSSRAALDSLFGVGVTADIYAKIRYKYFLAAAGCAASFYPLTLVSSSDTKIQYSTNIRDTMAYNLRPYISLGVSIREQTSSTISAGGVAYEK